MSATLPNLRELASWLRASVYECGKEARPLPLHEYAVDGAGLVRELPPLHSSSKSALLWLLHRAFCEQGARKEVLEGGSFRFAAIARLAFFAPARRFGSVR